MQRWGHQRKLSHLWVWARCKCLGGPRQGSRGGFTRELDRDPLACISTQQRRCQLFVDQRGLQWRKESRGQNRNYLQDWKKDKAGTSLVVQELGICLPMQGMQVWLPLQEDSTCHGDHNWACALEPSSHNYWSPSDPEPMLRSKRSRCNEKPVPRTRE